MSDEPVSVEPSPRAEDYQSPQNSATRFRGGILDENGFDLELAHDLSAIPRRQSVIQHNIDVF